MTLDTQAYRQTASRISAWQQTFAVPDLQFQKIQDEIQNLLTRLADFFRKIAQAAEETENDLMKDAPYSYVSAPGWKVEVKPLKVSGNPAKNGTLQSSFKASGAVGVVEVQKKTGRGQLSAGLSCGAAEMEAEGQIRLFKGKTFNPMIVLSASASAAAVSAKAGGSIGNSVLSARGSLEGEAGAVYAKAKAVLSKDEQTLSFNAGAAAVRGRCELAFKLGPIKLTVGLSGSVGSVGGGMEVSHKNRQALFSANLDFIAGIGLDFKIDY